MLDLSQKAKELITPLVEVPEIGYDFEDRNPKKSVDEHLRPFADRVVKKWGRSRCFVDMRLIAPNERMANGKHPMSFVFDELRSLHCTATPVTGLERNAAYQGAVKNSVSKNRQGLCIRLALEQAARPDIKSSIENLLGAMGMDALECDLVLDLEAPNFVPIAGFAKLIDRVIRNVPYLARWRTFTLCGTSFPSSMAAVDQGETIIARNEWLLYKEVVRSLAQSMIRLPTFGDYAINHPDVLSVDMRLVKPSATIRYAIDDAWLIIKGRNVRDNKFDQYREHCQTLTKSRHFLGETFSAGGKYIAECAAGRAGTGNLTTWRKVGTNHHLEKVVSDIATLCAS